MWTDDVPEQEVRQRSAVIDELAEVVRLGGEGANDGRSIGYT
jgi:hypothetical protein